MGKQKKTKKPLLKNKIPNGERASLKRLIQRQSEELKVKKEQLRNGLKKQKGAEKQIHIQESLTLFNRKGSIYTWV